MADANGTLSVVALLGPLVGTVGFGLRLELEVTHNTKFASDRTWRAFEFERAV